MTISFHPKKAVARREFANIRRSTRDRQKIQRLSPRKVEAIKRRQRGEGTGANGNVINYNEDDNDDDFDDFIDDDGVEEKEKEGRQRSSGARSSRWCDNDMKKNGAFFSAGTPPSAPKNGDDDNRVNGSTIPTILTRTVSMLCTQLPLLKEEEWGTRITSTSLDSMLC